jgi:hypothetical protein
MRPFIRRAVPLMYVPLALTVAVPSASAAPAGPAGMAPGWRAVATVTVRGADTALISVAPVSSRRAWIVGTASSRRSGRFRPVIESWNGTAWSRERPPAGVVRRLGQEPLLTTGAASGQTGLWAFTLLGGWLHFSGGKWTAGILPNHRFVQTSVTAGRAIWVFGGASLVARGNVPFAAFKVGTGAWTRTAVPGKGVFADASAVSGQDIWAVIGKGLFGAGVTRSQIGALVHWTGGHWTTVAGLPAALRNSSLSAVLARSDNDVWVGGATRNSKNGTTEAVGLWNGSGWTVTRLRAAATAAPFHIASMTADGSGGVWALGLCVTGRCPATGSDFRLWHETGGRWTGPIRPALAGAHRTVLIDVAGVGRSVWASGLVVTRSGNANGLIALWGPTPR